MTELFLNQTGRENLIAFILENTKGATVESAEIYIDSLDFDWDAGAFEISSVESRDGRPHVWDWDADNFSKAE